MSKGIGFRVYRSFSQLRGLTKVLYWALSLLCRVQKPCSMGLLLDGSLCVCVCMTVSLHRFVRCSLETLNSKPQILNPSGPCNPGSPSSPKSRSSPYPNP